MRLGAARRSGTRGWEAGNLESVMALYASDALVSSQGSREPDGGHDGVRPHVAQAFEEERAVRASMGVPARHGRSRSNGGPP
jgi:hypothetical protein